MNNFIDGVSDVQKPVAYAVGWLQAQLRYDSFAALGGIATGDEMSQPSLRLWGQSSSVDNVVTLTYETDS